MPVRTRAAICSQVVEDLSFQPLPADRFTARLLNHSGVARYNAGGFFVFTNLPHGSYQLQLEGRQFQSRTLPLGLTSPWTVVPAAEENELRAVIRQVETRDHGLLVEVWPLTNPAPVHHNAETLGSGFRGRLSRELAPGPLHRIPLCDAQGTLRVGQILRLLRQPALRLRFSPFYSGPAGVTVAAGQVQPAGPVRVAITGANGEPLTWRTVAGVALALVGCNGQPTVLGSRWELNTYCAHNGYFAFHFPGGLQIEELTLGLSGPGLEPSIHRQPVVRGQRSFAVIPTKSVQ